MKPDFCYFCDTGASSENLGRQLAIFILFFISNCNVGEWDGGEY